MVLSRAAINALIKSGCSCWEQNSPDDMWLGNCFRNLGVPVTHSPAFHQVSQALLFLSDGIICMGSNICRPPLHALLVHLICMLRGYVISGGLGRCQGESFPAYHGSPFIIKLKLSYNLLFTTNTIYIRPISPLFCKLHLSKFVFNTDTLIDN
jgi:hypothetical protein